MSSISKIVNKFAILKQLPVFGKLKWFELQKIANKCIFVEYKKGEIIREQGSPPDAFYCVVSGRIQAYWLTPDSGKKDIEFIHRGMYFGIISLLTGEGHSLTFEAINDSVVLKIEKEDFLEILEVIPRLGVEFSHSLSRRIRGKDFNAKSIFESTIISVYSPLKNSGSSTYALNLAFHLQRETNKKVIFVAVNSVVPDDASSGTASGASIGWKKRPVNLRDIAGDHQKILQSISGKELKFDLLDVCFDPSDLWLVGQISYFISLLATDYHFVVVDLPNEMDDVVFKTLTQSDTVHLITRDREEDLKLTSLVIDRLRKVSGDKFSKEKIQVMISGLEKKCYLSYAEINRAINYSILRNLPHIMPEELKLELSSDVLTAVLPQIESEYAQVIRSIARQLGGVLVGLVLGGGAALGIAHIGVLRVLEKENIPIDVVVGSSMGALLGSLWAIGKNADELESIAREFESKASMQKLIDVSLPRGGLLSGQNIKRWLRKHLGDKTFYDTKVPFKAIAYDLLRREELIIEEGSLVDAVRQSIAIPGIIQPIVKKDRLIIDGGVVNPLPTNVVAAMGIKKIIAVNVLQSPYDVVRGYAFIEKRMKEEEKIPFLKSPGRYIGFRLRRMVGKLFYPNIADIIVRGLQAVEYVISEQNAQQADVIIHPELIGVNWFELYEVNKLVKSGEDAAHRHLAEIKKLINE